MLMYKYMPLKNQPLMVQFSNLHDESMMILTLVLSLVLYSMINIKLDKIYDKHLSSSKHIYSTWMIILSTMTLCFAIPSLRTMYLMDEMLNSAMAMDHQWNLLHQHMDPQCSMYDHLNLPETEILTDNYTNKKPELYDQIVSI